MHQRIALLLLAWLPVWANAAGPLPGYFTPPASAVVGAGVQMEEYGQVDMPLRDSPNVQRGRRWSGDMVLQGVPSDASAAAIWARMKPAFLKGGWQVMHEAGGSATLRHRGGGKEA